MSTLLRLTQEKRDPKNIFVRDQLNRREEIDFITRLIAEAPGGFVLAIDGEWGTGKTTFLEMLADHLRNGGQNTQPHAQAISDGALVIEHNAWLNDFSKDPLLPLIREFDRAFKNDPRYASNESIKALASKYSKSAMALLSGKMLSWSIRSAGRIMLGSEVMSEIRDALDVSLSEAGNLDEFINDEQLEEFSSKISSEAGEALQKHMKAVFAAQDVERLQVKQFNIRLQKLAEAYKAASGGNFPIVVIIDELDRCRPTYAIEMLERIKHIFSVNDIVFILGIAREQLQHSIKAVYGDSFNAHGYLHRFIDVDYRLMPKLNDIFIRKTLGRISKKQTHLDSDLVDEFVIYARIFSLSSRDMEQVLTRYAVISMESAKQPTWNFSPFASYVRYQLCNRQARIYELLTFKIDKVDLEVTRASLLEIWRQRLKSEVPQPFEKWPLAVLIGYLSAQFPGKTSMEQILNFRSLYPQIGRQSSEEEILSIWAKLSPTNSFHQASDQLIEIGENFS
jgi:Cdc6-like AAA superfamily ATPase